MRWVIVGAGAVGGVMGARLIDCGATQVSFVARGAHADAIERHGLRVIGPDGESVVRPEAVWRPDAVGSLKDAIVVLAVKSHQTAEVLVQLGTALADARAVMCAQNGVTNELAVSEVYSGEVLGCMVWMPAVHLEPGVVESHGRPDGFLAIGRWPAAESHVSKLAAIELARAGFAAESVDSVAMWKRGKLLTNLGNAIDAFCTPGGRMDLFRRICAEGRAVFDALGMPYMDPDELTQRGLDTVDNMASGKQREGGSTWQSLARGPRAIEVSALNGYVADLAAAHDLPAPLNRGLAALAGEFERGERAPRSLDAAELDALLASTT